MNVPEFYQPAAAASNESPLAPGTLIWKDEFHEFLTVSTVWLTCHPARRDSKRKWDLRSASFRVLGRRRKRRLLTSHRRRSGRAASLQPMKGSRGRDFEAAELNKTQNENCWKCLELFFLFCS